MVHTNQIMPPKGLLIQRETIYPNIEVEINSFNMYSSGLPNATLVFAVAKFSSALLYIKGKMLFLYFIVLNQAKDV